MINTKFNRWKIISEMGRDKWGSRLFECICDCGKGGIVRLSDLKHNKTTQCVDCGYKFKRKVLPIIKSELSGKGNNYRHGMSRTSTYGAWCAIISRTSAKFGKNYKWYGSRGISICEEWKLFENFYNDMGDRPHKMYLDRIDNDLGYFKENCRWVNAKVNSQNRRCVINNKKKNKAVFRDDLPRY